MQEENAPEDCLKRYVKAFRERLGIRREEWLKIELDEILSRSSSHPTLSMRLKTLGVTNVVLCDEQKSPELAKDCLAAMEEMENTYMPAQEKFTQESAKRISSSPRCAWRSGKRQIVPLSRTSITT